MESGGFPIKAMEYEARKICSIHLMADLTSQVIIGLTELVPEQESLITDMKLRAWAIKDRVNDLAYPEMPYYPLDTVFKKERHPILGLFQRRDKHSLEETILIHGGELIKLASDLFACLDREGKMPH